ncbi:MAG: TSUP family transporter [Candidatus Omnitrophota bacterium]
MVQLFYIALGLLAGILSGIFGIGGGTILIPALVFLFGLTQLQAQGTTLAVMIPPIGLLAALRYYYSGNVKIGMAGFICLGFFLGGFLGAGLVQNFPDPLLKKAFGIFLLIISLRMILFK